MLDETDGLGVSLIVLKNKAVAERTEGSLLKFDVPVSEIEEVFPAFALAGVKDETDDRAPFGADGFADEAHTGLVGEAVGFAGITADAGADDVFPGGFTAAITRDDVVEVEVFAGEVLAAVLADILVAFEDVDAGELEFLAREFVEPGEQDHARHADDGARGVDGIDGFERRIIAGEIHPVHKVEDTKVVFVMVDDVGVATREEGKGALGTDDVHRLPEAV